jgi:hypothetical protein
MTSIIKVNQIQDGGGNTIISSNGSGTFTSNLPSVANTPNFKVRNNSDQSLSNNTITKLTLDTEVFDTDNAFASNKFTVPSGKAGKYQFHLQYSLETQYDSYLQNGYIYKNGSAINDAQTRLVMGGQNLSGGTELFLHVDALLNLSVGDYIEAYVKVYNTGGGAYVAKGGKNFLQGYKIIE